MFNSKELAAIDRNYFVVRQATPYVVVVQSKNTGHYWKIDPYEYTPGKNSCTLYHKHSFHDAYHRHKSGGTLADCLNEIKGHDSYQLQKNFARDYRRAKRASQKSRRFDLSREG